MAEPVNLEVTIGDVTLKTPLVGASGLFGYGGEYGDLLDYAAFGAIVTKTVTLNPRAGNPPPRIVDVGAGIINSIGLENVGSAVFLKEILPAIDLPCKLFVSIGGDSVGEYRQIAGLLRETRTIDAIEVNISCPNVERGGIAFGSDADETHRVTGAVRSETDLLVIVKLPPLVSGLDAVAAAACDGGADALAIANTYPAMAIDIEERRPILGGVSGGLSGRGIKPVSLLLTWKAAQAVDVPIIGVGGIETGDDAAEFILAGASAFEVGSIILRDVRAPSAIIGGLKGYMRRMGYERLEDFRGAAVGRGPARQEETRGKA